MQRYSVGFLMLLACILTEISSYPASNNEAPPLHLDLHRESSINTPIDKRSLPVEVPTAPQDVTTREIMEKIKAINEAIKKPHRRQQIKWNPQPQTGGGYIMDKEILEKLQEIISSGKLHGIPYQNNNNHDTAENSNDIRYSRQLNLPSNVLPISPYVMNLPVMVIPDGMHPNYLNVNGVNLLRDGNESPGGSPLWPFAQFFPILIRDPLLSIMNGGGWSNFIEYGQSADICRKQKSVLENYINEQNNVKENLKQELIESYADLDHVSEINNRQSRSLKKRTVSQETGQQEIDFNKNNKNTVTKKPTATQKLVLSFQQLQQLVNPGSKDDFRFGWFSGQNNANKDEVDLRKPGFFINRLRVRKGGVAIAGPGGVATAGRGGTAIVGPGGTALTQPGGIAVAGPAARVIALSPDADLSAIIRNLQQQQAASDGAVPFVHDISEGKVVATGPVVYYHPKQSLREREWRSFDGSYKKSWQWNNYGRRSDEFQYDGKNFVAGPLKFGKSNFRLILEPTAHAQIGSGTAIANPVSQVVVAKDKQGSIIHSPVASAIAGPGGIAHAQSDLYLYEAVQYLPFYGGAKGQYLEIKKDTRGTVTSEKIVSEDKLSIDNTKYGDDENENVLTRILAKNLHNLKQTSSELLKLINIGRRTGNLNNQDKVKFKNQMTSLGEALSNIIKVMDDIGDDFNSLFKNSDTYNRDPCSHHQHHHHVEDRHHHQDSRFEGLKEKSLSLRRFRQQFDDDEEDVGEEGVGVDAEDSGGYDDDGYDTGLIAEAKPVGLAVIGEHGIAASRPVGTAVAVSGVAIASPKGTAIAGIDPQALGINFQVNRLRKH